MSPKRKFINLIIVLANKFSFMFSDKLYLKLQFRLRMGYYLDLDNPKTLSEKIQWLKIHDRDPRYTLLVDKYFVKEYVGKIIGFKHIIPTIGIWDSPEQIEWEKLPRKFVLKTTHGGGSNGVIICTAKEKLDKRSIINKLKKALKQDIYNDFREWPYKNVQKRIIAEQFMSQDDGSYLIDYKFFCFNGCPKYVYVSRNVPGSKRKLSCFLTMDWLIAPFKKEDEDYVSKCPPKPDAFDKMIEFAALLSKDMSFARVDLYEVNKQIYFSEITLYPSSGMQPFEPPKWNKILGDLLILPNEQLKNYDKE